MGSGWTRDPAALELLEDSGNPFDTRAYREAFTIGYPGWHEASFGAVSDDGTRAALSMLAIRNQGESVPLGYGGVVSDAPLEEARVRSFLRAARRSAGVGILHARSVPGSVRGSVPGSVPGSVDAEGEQVGTTSIVELSAHEDVTAGYSEQGRRSLRKAEGSGAIVATTRDPRIFLDLYRLQGKGTLYSSDMVAELATAGLASFTHVVIATEPVACVAVLRGAGQRVYWLGAQSERGREIAASYLALTTVLREAHDDGIPVVNLGASVAQERTLEGVARFKRNLGGVDVPIFVLHSGTAVRSLSHVLRDGARRLLRRD